MGGGGIWEFKQDKLLVSVTDFYSIRDFKVSSERIGVYLQFIQIYLYGFPIW